MERKHVCETGKNWSAVPRRLVVLSSCTRMTVSPQSCSVRGSRLRPQTKVRKRRRSSGVKLRKTSQKNLTCRCDSRTPAVLGVPAQRAEVDVRLAAH